MSFQQFFEHTFSALTSSFVRILVCLFVRFLRHNFFIFVFCRLGFYVANSTLHDSLRGHNVPFLHTFLDTFASRIITMNGSRRTFWLTHSNFVSVLLEFQHATKITRRANLTTACSTRHVHQASYFWNIVIFSSIIVESKVLFTFEQHPQSIFCVYRLAYYTSSGPYLSNSNSRLFHCKVRFD